MPIVNQTIGSSETVIFTVPAGKNWANVFLMFCNSDLSNSESITLHARPAGEAVGNKNTILKNLVIDPTDSFAFNMEKLLMSAGDVLSAVGSAGGRVSVTASYLEL